MSTFSGPGSGGGEDTLAHSIWAEQTSVAKYSSDFSYWM